MKLNDSGLLELRIQSHTNSNQYESDITRVWTMLKDFVPNDVFSELSLRKAKNRLWDERRALTTKIRFSDSTMRNDSGTTLIASTGAEEGDLFRDSGAAESLDKFLDHGAHCDSSNIWFRPIDGCLNREVHVLLSGRGNEFAITANCTRLEYEYVLNELRAHNK